MFAKHYRGIPNNRPGFDLGNEPPRIGPYDFDREAHRRKDRSRGETPVCLGSDRDGIAGNRDARREFDRPRREVEALGVPVRIGGFGCFDRTPNDVARRWFEDPVSIDREFGWGGALGEFRSPFGIVGHGRPGPGSKP
ncbi:MAG: hypothetical protein SNJ76_08510 [Fimbriimonadaceae bacterium]